jgi:myb proto-oncogene protein
LNPELKKRPWTPEEDLMLLEFVLELGNKWAEISRRIKGKSEHVVKNRHKSLLKRA